MSVKSYYGVFAQFLYQSITTKSAFKYTQTHAHIYDTRPKNKTMRLLINNEFTFWPVKRAQTNCHLWNILIVKPSSTAKHYCFSNHNLDHFLGLFSLFIFFSPFWPSAILTLPVLHVYITSLDLSVISFLSSYELPPHALNINTFLLNLFIIPSKSLSFKTKFFT